MTNWWGRRFRLPSALLLALLAAPALSPQEDEPYFSLSSTRTWASNGKPTVGLLSLIHI